MCIDRAINSEEFKQDMINKELESAGLSIQFAKYRINDIELLKHKHALANQADCEVVQRAIDSIEKNESLFKQEDQDDQDDQEDVDVYKKAYEDYWRNKNGK